jgi:DNA-binding transcriptional LysR family regulator
MKNPTPGLLKAKIEARLSEDLSRRIDAWIAAQPEPRPNRSEAIRRLVTEALRDPMVCFAPASPPSSAFLRAQEMSREKARKSRGRR